MSIAVERGGFIHGISTSSCFPIYESPEAFSRPDGHLFGTPANRSESASCSSSSSSSSSIGRDSDEEDADDGEVQSRNKGALDVMDALEESLPIKRGVSEFYSGRTKSFTSLEDAVSSSSSAKDLAKPDNPYTRKRKNLLALRMRFDGSSQRSPEGGLSKRPAISSRSMLCLESSISRSKEEHETPCLPPPFHPRGRPLPPPDVVALSCCPMRSFSLADLQGVRFQ